MRQKYARPSEARETYPYPPDVSAADNDKEGPIAYGYKFKVIEE